MCGGDWSLLEGMNAVNGGDSVAVRLKREHRDGALFAVGGLQIPPALPMTADRDADHATPLTVAPRCPRYAR
jgi:hypothetical protein